MQGRFPTSTMSKPLFPRGSSIAEHASPTSTISPTGSVGSVTRGRTSFHLPRHPRRRSSTMTTGTTFSSAVDFDGEDDFGSFEEEEEWEGGDEGEEYVAHLGQHPQQGHRSQSQAVGRDGRGRKKDEPMSPMAVVFYVVMFYLIWQLLTRSTEGEILAHVAPSSSLAQHLSESELSSLGIRGSGSGVSFGGYNLPYHFPHIPSPIPPTSSSSSSTSAGGPAPSPGFFRLAIGVLFYPVYLVATLLAIPLPLLLNALHLLWAVTTSVLYPFTLTAKVGANMFLLTPLGWAGTVFRVLSPFLAFIVGVLGCGCVMGLGVGWAGRKVLDLILGRKRAAGKAGKGKGRMGRSARGKSRRSRSEYEYDRSHAMPPHSQAHRQYEDANMAPGPMQYVLADEQYTGDTHLDQSRARTIAARRRSTNAHSGVAWGANANLQPIQEDTHYHHHQHGRRSPSSSGAESVPPNPRTPRTANVPLTVPIPFDAAGEERDHSPSRRFRQTKQSGKGRDREQGSHERDGEGAVLGTRRRGVFAGDQHAY